MRPLSLVIDGINSFSDRQKIDFAFDGLFCISGDTGSGKTTILDCIIIALYGNGKRASSLNDYINLKRDRAEIKFVFEMTVGGERTTFEVSRTLVRDGASRAKLVDLTHGVAIAEQTVAVNEALEEMIGLTREDFTQVVVLEQGKFSKFLTATKKERNETVGNLFKLGKYKDLGRKFGEKRTQVKIELDGITARLEELKDVTAAAVAEKEKALKSNAKKAERLAEDEKKQTAELDDYRELKRVFDRCIDAANRLETERARSIALRTELETATAKLAQITDEINNMTAQKNDYELIVARIGGLMGLIEERKKRIEGLDTLRKEWKKASDERAALQKDYDEIDKKLRSVVELLDKRLAELKKIADYGETNGYCDVFDIKSRIEKAAAELENSAHEYEAAAKKTKELVERVATDDKNLLAAMERVAEAQKKYSAFSAQLDELKRKRESERKTEAVIYLRNGLHKGDICPVCGGVFEGEHGDACQGEDISEAIKAKEAEVAAAQKVHNELENNKYSFSARCEESRKAFAEAQLKLNEAKAKLDECGKMFADATRVNEAVKAAAEACELYNRYVMLKSESAVAKQKLESAIKRADEIKERGEVERAEADRLDKTINERLGSNKADELDDIKRKIDLLSAKTAEMTTIRTRIESERDKTASESAACDAAIKLLGEQAAAVPKFDAEILREKEEGLARLKSQREELIATMAGDENALAELKKDLELKRKLEADKAEKKKMFDIYTDIYKLVSGDKFIEYVAEEYILQFTSSASAVLGDITGGKYTLEYKDGAFFVKDFLSGGMERKAGTLSGGETFLASLSLAIAISREIARFKTYEFFFLDEGFGTLDVNSIDTVLGALSALASDTLVGVVTHRAEITDRIFDKIRVLSANGEQGSRIEISN